MNLKKLIIVFVVATAAMSHANAFEPLSLLHGHSKCWPDCVGKFCCDDYCAKPLPCLPLGKTRFDCDDYCRKPIPCQPAGKTTTFCDEYCRKPLPPVCYAGGKNLSCIPNRLPPIDSYVPNKLAESTSRLETTGGEQLEVTPASSSRRVHNTSGLNPN